jgi:hypothetical protein
MDLEDLLFTRAHAIMRGSGFVVDKKMSDNNSNWSWIACWEQ